MKTRKPQNLKISGLLASLALLAFAAFSPRLSAQHSPYTAQITNDPAFSAWLSGQLIGGGRSTAGHGSTSFTFWPGPEQYGGVADAAVDGTTGVITGTDNTAAINACLRTNGVCYLSPGEAYGIKGSILIGSREILASKTDQLAWLVRLDDTNLDNAHPSSTNGLDSWGGPFHADVMVRGRDSMTVAPVIRGIVFDANGGWAHRRAINAGTNNTDDGTYTPGSQPIHLVGEAQRVLGCEFRNLVAFAGTKTQTYFDPVAYETNTLPRLAAVPESFPLFFGILTDLSTWLPNWDGLTNRGLSDYVWHRGPSVIGCRFVGPLRGQSGTNEFPARTSSTYLSRPEITLVTAAGYIRTAAGLNAADISGTNSVIYYPYQGYDGVIFAGNTFENLNIWRNSDIDKQLAVVHGLTVGACRNVTIANNRFQNVDGVGFYVDNNVLLGGSITGNTSDGGIMKGIGIDLGAYTSGYGRYGTGGWVRDLAIMGNDWQISGQARLAGVAMDSEGTVSAAIMAGVGQSITSSIGQHSMIYPRRWISKLGPSGNFVDTNGVFIGDLGDGHTNRYIGDDAYPPTGTQPGQESLFANITFANNKSIAIATDVQDLNLTLSTMLRLETWTYFPGFANCAVTRNTLDTLAWAEPSRGYLPTSSEGITVIGLRQLSDIGIAGNLSSRGQLFTVSSGTTGLRMFQQDDPSTGIWGLYRTTAINTNTVSADYPTVVATNATTGMVYLCASYRGTPGASGYSMNSIPFNGSTRFVVQNVPAGFSGLVLPYPDARMVGGVWYDGNAPLGVAFEVQNATAGSLQVFASGSATITDTSHNGTITVGGASSTTGLTVSPGGNVRLLATDAGHYTQIN